MANVLGTYDPIFYANEALEILYKALGMARRVHIGYDEERKSFNKGSVVEIRKPSTFVAASAPAAAVDLATETTLITLNQWKEVKFKLSDKELAYTQEQIIAEHIVPAAFALADDIDQALIALIDNVPWVAEEGGNSAVAQTMGVGDITANRKTLFDNKVPLMNPQMLHAMLDGETEADLLANSAFSQHQGAGDTGVDTQMRGTLGQKFGFEHFANQNVKDHLSGTASVTALLTNGAIAKGATSAPMDAALVTGTLTVGDTFVIAGNTQRYAVTALTTAATNAFASVAFTPAAVQAYGDNVSVTVDLNGTAGANKTRTQIPYFHTNAFALVTAPLSEMGGDLGAKIAVIRDPFTNLTLRSRIYYVGNSSEVHVALDILYGVKTLNPNLAMRMIKGAA